MSPGRFRVHVADADVAAQILNRKNDFPRPTELYDTLDLLGRNVFSTEGAVWRQHRKIASPAFHEANNALVWAETLRQTSSMLESWLPDRDSGREISNSIWKVHDAVTTLSLHVISRAGFGQDMLWPLEQERLLGPGGQHQLPRGHDMSFSDSLRIFVEHTLYVLMLPEWLRCTSMTATRAFVLTSRSAPTL